MTRTFVIGDTHFGHTNMVTRFGRDQFTDVNHMNEHIIDRWNKTVGPEDKVFHLGDFCMTRRWLPIAGRLNGRKVLVMGNHDILSAHEYLEYFEDVVGIVSKKGYWLSHMPIMERRDKISIHGHTHGKWNKAGYVDVSVEAIDYTPKNLVEVLSP